MEAFDEYPKFKYQGMVATYVTSREQEDALEGVYTDAPVQDDGIAAVQALEAQLAEVEMQIAQAQAKGKRTEA